NQEGADTSYFIMGAFTEQGNNEFDLFLAVLQDTTFPVQPRTWDIPGQGNPLDPLSLESIVIFIPELDSVFVLDLIETLTDTTGGDSLALDSLFESLFFELNDNLYLGLPDFFGNNQGVLEISEISDSSFSGDFYATLTKPVLTWPLQSININNGLFVFNKISLPVLAVKSKPKVPERLILFPAYPNPFNPSTTVRFSVLDTKQPLSLHIYDIDGRLIETLFSGYVMPGFHEFQWNARQYPSGIYFAMFRSGDIMQTTKLILIK
ncbi:MAG: T9SS type A sorting domain-containing protein, partial [Fidelibacterota bacterium]